MYWKSGKVAITENMVFVRINYNNIGEIEMHLFLQVCGVIGFALLGLSVTHWMSIHAATSDNETAFYAGILSTVSFVLISTYFIFG